MIEMKVNIVLFYFSFAMKVQVIIGLGRNESSKVVGKIKL